MLRAPGRRQGAKPKGEVMATILTALNEHRA